MRWCSHHASCLLYKPVGAAMIWGGSSRFSEHEMTFSLMGKKKKKIYILHIYNYIYIMKTCAAGDTESKESEQQSCFHDQSITRINKITDLMLSYACVNCYYRITLFQSTYLISRVC